MGTVDKGKLADLVLLDGNPLAAIDNVRKRSGRRRWACAGQEGDRRLARQSESTNRTAH